MTTWQLLQSTPLTYLFVPHTPPALLSCFISSSKHSLLFSLSSLSFPCGFLHFRVHFLLFELPVSLNENISAEIICESSPICEEIGKTVKALALHPDHNLLEDIYSIADHIVDPNKPLRDLNEAHCQILS